MLGAVVISQEMYKLSVVLGVDDILKAIRFSTRVTHPEGNYRYENIVFNIVDGVLIGIAPFHQKVVDAWGVNVIEDLGDGLVVAQCPDCEGAGVCNTCNSTGRLRGLLQDIKGLL